MDAPDPDEGKRKVYRRTEEAKDYLVVFGARLRELRDEAGMTQAVLAGETGMHRVSLARAEKGQMEVGVTNVVRLAAALGVSPGDLFDVPPAPGR